MQNGQIVVSASKKEVTSKVGRIVARKRTKDQAQTQGQVNEETVVIVGGGSGGIHTIESLRMVSILSWEGTKVELRLRRMVTKERLL